VARVRVGLTGGIASGKSLVADELAARGAVVIDADVLAREVVEPGTDGLAAVVARFGDDVLDAGRLDRSRLGRIVFADSDARRDLERIVHPAVRARAAELERAAPPDAVVVHVIPLLVETGQQDQFDFVVVVDVDPAIQLARLVARDGLDAADAQARLAAQASQQERRAVTDVVIDNGGSVTDLKARIGPLWQFLTSAEPRN
jgi:dephospho-CoA kinase